MIEPILGTLAAVFIAWLAKEFLWPAIVSRWKPKTLTPSPRITSLGVSDTSLPHGFIPLHEAAARLYTEARSSRHLMAGFAEHDWGLGRRTGSEGDILDWMATYLCYSKRKPLQGRKPPSTRLEPISFEEVKRRSFVEGATKLQRHNTPTDYFTDLIIKETDVDEVMEEMMLEAEFHDD